MGAIAATTASTALSQSAARPKGMARLLAAAVSLETDPTTSSLDEVRIKAPNHQTSLPTPFDPAIHNINEDFSLSTIFAFLGNDLHKLDINAMSTDNAIPPLDPQGQLNLYNLWASLNITVSSTTMGNRDGTGKPLGLIGIRHDRPGVNHGSDIYGHYFAASSTIPANMLGETLLEIGAPKVRANLPGQQIDALDFSLGVRAHNQIVGPEFIFLGDDTEFYFSVTEASAAEIGSFPGLSRPVNPGVIYVTRYAPGNGNNRLWTDPEEFYDVAQYSTGNKVLDVDGIAYGDSRGTLIFSTTLESQDPLAPRPQIEVVNAKLAGATPVELLAAPGVSSMAAFALDQDSSADVTGLCILDPESSPSVVSKYLGTPSESPVPTSHGGPVATLTASGGENAGDAVLFAGLTGVRPGAEVFMSLSTLHNPATGSQGFDWSPPVLMGTADEQGEFVLEYPLPAQFPLLDLSVVFISDNGVTPIISNASTIRATNVVN